MTYASGTITVSTQNELDIFQTCQIQHSEAIDIKAKNSPELKNKQDSGTIQH